MVRFDSVGREKEGCPCTVKVFHSQTFVSERRKDGLCQSGFETYFQVIAYLVYHKGFFGLGIEIHILALYIQFKTANREFQQLGSGIRK